MQHILTIDLEDWHQLVYRRITGQALPPTKHVFRQLDTVLELLHTYNVKATFFVLGMVAQYYPDLIRSVAAQGHEIASHGYAHLTVDRMSREQFVEDTKRGKALLEDITGKPVVGYRAAEFSVRSATLWALEVLAELGFTYDSSIFPIHHRRYGIADFCPQVMRYDLRNGLQIIEIPLATMSLARFNVPVAGGGYFRLLPSWLIACAVRRLQAAQRPVVSYFHPYEFDVQRLDIFSCLQGSSWKDRLRAWRLNFHQNLGRRTMSTKLAALLRQFRFGTCQDFLNGAPTSGSQKLFSAKSR